MVNQAVLANLSRHNKVKQATYASEPNRSGSTLEIRSAESQAVLTIRNGLNRLPTLVDRAGWAAHLRFDPQGHRLCLRSAMG